MLEPSVSKGRAARCPSSGLSTRKSSVDLFPVGMQLSMWTLPACFIRKDRHFQGKQKVSISSGSPMKFEYNSSRILFYLFFEMEFCCCCPGYSAMAQSQLTATSTSQIQRQGFFMSVRLVSNSRPQVIRPPWLPKVLGLQVDSLTLLSKLECSGMIIVHDSLQLLDSSDLPASASQVARTTGKCHHTQPVQGVPKAPTSHERDSGSISTADPSARGTLRGTFYSMPEKTSQVVGGKRDLKAMEEGSFCPPRRQAG
ncbi:hypothetical protein AAY473_029830 [Plecturocebus cupreus]